MSSIYASTKVYALSNIIRNAVSIIMLPVYTRLLTPEDYGIVELLNIIVDITSIILGLRISESLFREWSLAKSEQDKNSVFSTSIYIALIFNVIGFFLIYFSAPSLNNLLFENKDLTNLIILYAVTIVLIPLIEIPLVYIRAIDKPWLYFNFSLMKLVLQISFNLYFLIVKGYKVEGVVYSAVLSSLITATILQVYLISHTGLLYSKTMRNKIIGFSFPIMLSALGSLYITSGDRFYINHFWGLTELGIYSLSYKFGFMFMLLTYNPFSKVWDAKKYKLIESDSYKEIQEVFYNLNIILIIVGLFIALFAKEVLFIMSSSEFHVAHEVIPIIMLAFVINAWSQFCNLGILYSGKTSQLFIAEIIAVVVITISYYFLIKYFGATGAAWATFIGFSARLYWVYRATTKLTSIRLSWSKSIIFLIIACLISGIGVYIDYGFFLDVGLKIILFSAFILTMLKMNIMEPRLLKLWKDNVLNRT